MACNLLGICVNEYKTGFVVGNIFFKNWIAFYIMILSFALSLTYLLYHLFTNADLSFIISLLDDSLNATDLVTSISLLVPSYSMRYHSIYLVQSHNTYYGNYHPLHRMLCLLNKSQLYSINVYNIIYSILLYSIFSNIIFIQFIICILTNLLLL